MRIRYLLALALLMAAFSATSAQAAGNAEGPAGHAVEQWFSKSHRDATVQNQQIFYDKSGPYAIAVMDYSSSGGGSAMYCAVGVFRKDQAGKYAFVKQAKPSDGIYGQTESVAFKGNTATVSAKVFKSGDPRCCPTGKKTWKIALP